MMAETYLDTIVAAHRATAAADRRPFEQLLDEARTCPQARRFGAALREGFAVIAEVKRKSPSKGAIDAQLDPTALATAYTSGGAACVSVLTDTDYFGGSVADLTAVRNAVDVPVLRKDFTVSAADVCDARIMGADALLLIVAALDDAELADLHALTLELGFDALVEVHDEAELERALRIDAALVGVNQRDLFTFAVDTDRAVRVASRMPEGVVRVAESGIAGPADAVPLVAAGYHAVLVGESLVRSADPAGAVAALRAVGHQAHR
jgi:indole-3-glycerol phosphate synthase